MASTATAADGVIATKPKRVAGTIITGHGFQHMYADGFLVLLPIIQDVFMLGPVALGVLSTTRQAAGGLLSMGGGFMVDMFAGNRGILLAGSLFLMALAYLIAGAAPNFAILVIGVSLGSAAGSFWHPVGLGILSYTLPGQPGADDVAAPLRGQRGRGHHALHRRRCAHHHVVARRAGRWLLPHLGRLRGSAGRSASPRPAGASADREARRGRADEEHRRAVQQPRPSRAARGFRPAGHG